MVCYLLGGRELQRPQRGPEVGDGLLEIIQSLGDVRL